MHSQRWGSFFGETETKPYVFAYGLMMMIMKRWNGMAAWSSFCLFDTDTGCYAPRLRPQSGYVLISFVDGGCPGWAQISIIAVQWMTFLGFEVG